MFYFVAVLFMLCLIGLFVAKNWFIASRKEKLVREARRTQMAPEEIEAIAEATQFPVPRAVTWLLVGGVLVFGGWGLFNDTFFYAEPGFKYHVRTITGEEKVVDDVGYNMHLFGRIEPWKKALSVLASNDVSSGTTSSNLGPNRVTFLDQVDAQISATARFRLPTDPEQFLEMAQEYRTQANLLNTTLVPAFKETIRANAALMGAEDYFSGAQTQFNIDFEDQLNEGLYIVRRNEIRVSATQGAGTGTANASLGTDQGDFGDDDKVVFEVQKVLNSQGVARRKAQSFAKLGVTVVEARVTNVVPNDEFIARMGLKQKASADRAIAREQRVQEEEQRLLADTRGQREVAEQRAAALVEQIKVTTDAETQKQLAITNANREKERAKIEQEQAAILLEKAKIDAEARTVAADAEAYSKRAVIEADNALAQKLATLEAINEAWAEAYSKRAVPTTVFGGGGEAGGMTSDTGAQDFMDILTMKAAKDLAVDLDIKRGDELP